MIQSYRGVTPKAPPSVFVADSARVIGDVELGEDASVWFCTVVRGDVNVIRIGRGSRRQHCTVVHVHRHGTPTIVGDDVTVGHAARLHGCTIASHCLVGIGAIVLDGVEIGEESLVAAGSLSASVRRAVTAADLDLIRGSAKSHLALKTDYLAAAAPPRG